MRRTEKITMNDTENLAEIFRSIDVLCYANQFELIDSWFENIDTIEISWEYKVGIIRYCFSFREKFLNWNLAVEKMYKQLEDIGEEADRILKGLL